MAVTFSSSLEKRASLASILHSSRASLYAIFCSNFDKSGARAAWNIRTKSAGAMLPTLPALLVWPPPISSVAAA